MKKISLSKRIENYLRKHGGWVHKGVLEELIKKATYMKKGKVCHYLAENGDRRCREMVQGRKSDGSPIPITLEKREVGNSVEYRYLQGKPIQGLKARVKIIDNKAYLIEQIN